eukprot:Stramenopile-MAST_4_protein_3910
MASREALDNSVKTVRVTVPTQSCQVPSHELTFKNDQYEPEFSWPPGPLVTDEHNRPISRGSSRAGIRLGKPPRTPNGDVKRGNTATSQRSTLDMPSLLLNPDEYPQKHFAENANAKEPLYGTILKARDTAFAKTQEEQRKRMQLKLKYRPRHRNVADAVGKDDLNGRFYGSPLKVKPLARLIKGLGNAFENKVQLERKPSRQNIVMVGNNVSIKVRRLDEPPRVQEEQSAVLKEWSVVDERTKSMPALSTLESRPLTAPLEINVLSQNSTAFSPTSSMSNANVEFKQENFAEPGVFSTVCLTTADDVEMQRGEGLVIVPNPKQAAMSNLLNTIKKFENWKKNSVTATERYRRSREVATEALAALDDQDVLRCKREKKNDVNYHFKSDVEQVQEVYVQGGDLHFYSDEAISKREHLLDHADVQHTLLCFWEVVLTKFCQRSNGTNLNMSEYVSFHRVLYTVFNETDSEELGDGKEDLEWKKAAEEDWKNDCHELGALGKEQFKRALFELADIWCNSIQVNDYVDFLQYTMTRMCELDLEDSTTSLITRRTETPMNSYLQSLLKGLDDSVIPGAVKAIRQTHQELGKRLADGFGRKTNDEIKIEFLREGHGELTLRQFCKAVERLGINLLSEPFPEPKWFFSLCDTNRSGTIDYREFLVLVQILIHRGDTEKSRADVLNNAFDVYKAGLDPGIISTQNYLKIVDTIGLANQEENQSVVVDRSAVEILPHRMPRYSNRMSRGQFNVLARSSRATHTRIRKSISGETHHINLMKKHEPRKWIDFHVPKNQENSDSPSSPTTPQYPYVTTSSASEPVGDYKKGHYGNPIEMKIQTSPSRRKLGSRQATAILENQESATESKLTLHGAPPSSINAGDSELLPWGMTEINLVHSGMEITRARSRDETKDSAKLKCQTETNPIYKLEESRVERTMTAANYMSSSAPPLYLSPCMVSLNQNRPNARKGQIVTGVAKPNAHDAATANHRQVQMLLMGERPPSTRELRRHNTLPVLARPSNYTRPSSATARDLTGGAYLSLKKAPTIYCESNGLENKPPPPGWTRHLDSKGGVFFAHEASGISQRVYPTPFEIASATQKETLLVKERKSKEYEKRLFNKLHISRKESLSQKMKRLNTRLKVQDKTGKSIKQAKEDQMKTRIEKTMVHMKLYDGPPKLMPHEYADAVPSLVWN